MSALPNEAVARKAVPIFSGVVKYFPDALAAIAELSKIGNEQHNPGKPLHWDRSKSGDELDALTRHLVDAGTIDIDGVRHSTKVAWRALANLQKEIENADDLSGVTPESLRTWQPWDGRGARFRPCNRGTEVEVRFQDNTTSKGHAGKYRWTWTQSRGDIIQWRVAP